MQNRVEIAFLAFMVFAAAFNFVTKPRTPEELASFSPRAAAFFRFMNGAFPDPEKILEASWQFWKGTHDRLPSKRPGAPDDDEQ